MNTNIKFKFSKTLLPTVAVVATEKCRSKSIYWERKIDINFYIYITLPKYFSKLT